VNLLLHLIILCSLHQNCFAQRPSQNNKIRIGLLFDTTNFEWVGDIFYFVLSLINDKGNGWHDEIFANEYVSLEGDVANSGCDERKALDAYWSDLRKNNTPPHAIIGCRCSGATSMVARVAGLERIPQVSPTATSSKLSDTEEYPYLSRMVAPDDGRGQVGAMVSMLRSFGWNRVSILTTDTAYAKDFANEFRRLWLVSEENADGENWEGEVAYTNTILLNTEHMIDEESVHQALAGVPTDDPTINSRVILLLAHSHHAYPILEAAAKTSFQPDTIWVGIDAWIGQNPIATDWIPPVPGYLGLAPYTNENNDYLDFLTRLQHYQYTLGMEIWETLPDGRVGLVVDAVVSLAKALSLVENRRDGDAITSVLRNLTFGGVSGEVSFTPEGDRHKPLYSVLNLQKEENGEFKWKNVATTGVDLGDFGYGEGKLCFPGTGCVLDFNDEIPSDRYPVPAIPTRYQTETALWALIVLPIVTILFLLFAYRYCRTKKKKKALQYSISSMQQKMKIDSQLDNLNEQIEEAKKKKENLIKERFRLQQRPETWTDTDKTLVEVMPSDSEYWDIFYRLRQDMPTAYIAKVWRVQNLPLWTYYSFHKDRFVSMDIDENEGSVWHGTTNLDPEVIYNDKQDGFMMQFSQKGFWGRGIYFAEKSSYSHMYAYKPPTSRTSIRNSFSIGDEERPRAEKADEREMFLTKLLVGSEVFINREESPAKAEECRRLTVPPVNPDTNLKYNSVSGETAGSKVFVVYENGRAYPEYLVRYYQSKARDENRTPYETRDEANKELQETAPSLLSVTAAASAPPAPTSVTGPSHEWKYFDNDGSWKLYSPAHQTSLENAFQLWDMTKNGKLSRVQIQTDEWTYEIQFDKMTQRNLVHPNHKERKVMRLNARQLSGCWR